jgi:hypothetical protein
MVWLLRGNVMFRQLPGCLVRKNRFSGFQPKQKKTRIVAGDAGF